jgi:site-specific recombinase XerD
MHFLQRDLVLRMELLSRPGTRLIGHLVWARFSNRTRGYTHCNRHTFASRLVMAGVDLLTVQRLGGWRTVGMVTRYAHLAPHHLRAAVERLSGVELGVNLVSPAAADTTRV